MYVSGRNIGIFFYIIFCFSNNIFAQLQVTSGGTATSIAQALVGPGVTVTNAVLNCPSNAYGTFSNGGTTNLGITTGIILTSGSATAAIGPNASGSAGANNSVSGDSQLNGLAGASTFDACGLEFDVLPVCDTIKFLYVFGSEEYPEYVNSSFNDAFAFFISGPGITGQQNISLVPGSTNPVTIDNINAGNNSQYYVNNTGGSTIQYDGFTAVLTAFILVQACQTYHIKIVIADAGDGIYDSGVMLQQGTLNCLSVTAAATGQNAIEGCQNGTIQFTRGGSTTSSQTINYTIAGTATNGTDYNSLSGSITIPSGQASGTLNLIPISDGLPESTETVMIIYQPSNCAPNDTVTLTIGDQAILNAGPDASFCSGSNSVIGITQVLGYTYSWSPATGLSSSTSSNPTVTLTNTGTTPVTTNYTLTAISGSCTSSDVVSVTVNPAPAITPSQTNVFCTGGNTGSASISISNGDSPYSYSWSPNVSSTNSATNISAGTYSVTVTNVNSCSSVQGFTISEPAALSAVPSQANVSCFNGTNGSASVAVSGGAGSYSYLWLPNVSTTNIANNLSAGNYSVTATDANGCTITQSFTISEPGGMTGIPSQTNVTCNGASDGSASISISGGVTNYTYIWTSNVSTTNNANNLSMGIYVVTVTDANNCTLQQSFNITETSPLSLSPSQTDVLCFGNNTGKATVAVNGGATPYTYNWTGGISLVDSAVNLPAGPYSVTVTDASGCTTTQNFTISEPSTAVDVTLVSQNNVSCFGANDGSITVNTSGGISPYTYQWLMNVSATNAANNLITGTHGVMVTDANSCQDTMSFVITQPTALTSTAIQTNVSCFGGNDGSASVNASGGTTPYTYLWNTGAGTQNLVSLQAGNYNVTVTDANSCTTIQTYTISQPTAPLSLTDTFINVSCNGGSNGSASVTATGGTTPYTYTWTPAASSNGNATNLTAGAYDITVTDNKNCTTTQSFTITQPPALSLTVTTTNVLCNNGCDGTANPTLTGGITPYTYTWSGGQATPNVTSLCAGSYTLNTSDSNNCTASASFIISEPTAFTIIPDSTNSNCGQNDGSAGVSVTGATTPYSYQWSNSQVSATAINIIGGNHCVTITDNNGCDTTICITVTDNPPPTATASATEATCNGDCNGTVTVTAMGGNPPGNTSYTYLWSNTQTQATLFSQCAGTYYVTVTDNKNCTATDTAIITEPTAVTLTAPPDDTICIGKSTQLSAVAGNGNGAPYSYSWDNAITTDTQTVSPSANTCYIVSATDKQGCPSPADTQCVSLLSPVTVDATPDLQIICNNDPVQFNANASGGDNTFIYSWTDINGNVLSSLSSLQQTPSGTYPDTVNYFVIADDQCSPKDTDTVQVTFYQNPVANFSPGTTFGCEPLTVTFTNTSTPPSNLATCSWDFGNGSPTFIGCNNIPPQIYNVGTYDVQLTVISNNGNNCNDKELKPDLIQVNPNPIADFTASPQPTNVQNMLIQFSDLSTGNGNNITSWKWLFYDNGQNPLIGNSTSQNPEFNFSSTENPSDIFTYFLEDTGDYPVTLMISTQYGCKDTIEKMIHVEGVYYMNIPNAFTPNGDGINDVFFPSGVGILPEQNFNFYIFDRWGDIIFKSSSLNKGWDGKDFKGDLVPEAVYVWRLDLDNVVGEHPKYIGHVTVIRK